MPTKGNINLTAVEQRYCRCVVEVAGKGGARNPYAICTSSVYNKQSRHRGRVPPCSENYNFHTMKRSELEGYAKLHKIPVSSYNRLSDAQLANKLDSFVTSKYGSRRGSGTGISSKSHSFPSDRDLLQQAKLIVKSGKINHRNVWLEYVKLYRDDHPELSYKEALVRASKEYQAVKY